MKRTTKNKPQDRFAGLECHLLTEGEQASLLRLALEVLAVRHAPGQPLSSPKDTAQYLRLAFEGYKNEVFSAVFLDTRHRVLAFEELFFGTIDGASVHPRVVVQRSLELNAAAVIFAHNHPSGVSEPSRSDEMLTHRLKEALALIDVRVLDHIVVGHENTTSMAERGLI